MVGYVLEYRTGNNLPLHILWIVGHYEKHCLELYGINEECKV